ncbi:MAG: 3D domain-containing protein [Peptococcaceae bacterium]|nr:3D domain-containing protein [Peptococcaceae bacterium]MDH7525111.1 3D domain-containing protein [Peptococcaceae bacterium]
MKPYQKGTLLITASLFFVIAGYFLLAKNGEPPVINDNQAIIVPGSAKSDMTVQVDPPTRTVLVEKKSVSEQKRIDFPIEKVPDNSLYKGEQRILQKGIPGLELRVYEVILEDGQETARKLIESVQVRKPVRQVVAVGTLTTVSRGGNSIEFKEMLEMKATGYTHTGSRTSTDVWPSRGIAAVDPRVIPLGTRLYVDGYGYAAALDTGSAIRGNRIDLFFETRDEALRWGRRSVKVFILK